MDEFEARARSFVRARFPMARAAFLGGSAGAGAATTTSDLDILIVLPEEWAEVSFVETTRFDGQLVEAFVYGPVALDSWLRVGRDDVRPVLDRLIADGVSLIPGGLAESLTAESRAILMAGSAADAHQLDLRRYGLSALVDDLADSTDPAERRAVMAAAWREAAELALVAEGRWLGTGKWLIRELRAAGEPFGLAAYAAGRDGDGAVLGEICRAVIDAQGGHLQDGFIRGAKPSGLLTPGG